MVHGEPIVKSGYRYIHGVVALSWSPLLKGFRIQDLTCAAGHRLQRVSTFGTAFATCCTKLVDRLGNVVLHVSDPRSNHSKSQVSAVMIHNFRSGGGMGGGCEEKAGNNTARRPWLKPLLITFSAVIILHLLTLVLILNVVDLPNTTASHQDLDSRTGLENAPGVGFDLTPSYGAAAVRHHNGSVTNVGRVPVDPDYEEMMNRLSIGRRVL